MTQSIGNKSNEKGQFKTIVNLTQKIIRKEWNMEYSSDIILKFGTT